MQENSWTKEKLGETDESHLVLQHPRQERRSAKGRVFEHCAAIVRMDTGVICDRLVNESSKGLVSLSRICEKEVDGSASAVSEIRWCCHFVGRQCHIVSYHIVYPGAR